MSSTQRQRLREITGRHNALVKELRRAFAQGELTPEGYCAIEGTRIIEEAIRSGLKFRAIFFSQSGAERAQRLLPQIGAHVETVVLPDPLFSSVVPSETPQGVAALVRMKQFELEDVVRASTAKPLLLGIVGLQDPGNLGTLIRSAEAFGANGILRGEKTVSPYNSKVVRASAGSVFRLPIVRGQSSQFLATLRERGLRLLATSSHKGTPLDQADLADPAAVWIGSEGAGLPREVLSQCDELVMIPHAERVESLNAGVAGSILLYEASRQRRS